MTASLMQASSRQIGFGDDRWSERARRPTAGSLIAALLLSTFGLVVAAFGFAIPMAVRLVESGRISAAPSDLATARALEPDGWLIMGIGIVHVVVAAMLLGNGTFARRAASVLAGAGLVVAGATAVAALSGTGWFAGSQAHLGAPRVQAASISLVLGLLELVSLVSIRSRGRPAFR